MKEGGKALGVIAEAMKTQPLAFGFVITNVMWIAFFFWFAWTLREHNAVEQKFYQGLFQECKQELKELRGSVHFGFRPGTAERLRINSVPKFCTAALGTLAETYS